MAFLEWDDSFETGIAEIDTQHRKLLKMISDFYDKMIENNKEAISNLLDSLVLYTIYHFKTEENYFEKFGYEESESHIREHDSFREKVSKVKRLNDDGKAVLSLDLTSFLKTWIIKHIKGSDMQFVKCFKENGL